MLQPPSDPPAAPPTAPSTAPSAAKAPSPARERLVRDAVALLKRAAADHAPAAFASSLSAEDMVLHDLIDTAGIDIGIFTLDTGRLNDETHAVLAAAAARYRTPVRVYRPDPDAVNAFVGAHGADAFYDAIAHRKRCCEIRKLEPLRDALRGKRAWITGQRRQQSVTRAALETVEWDAANGMWKFNPLAHWSRADVWDYIARRDVPYNALHDRGYASIGCAPCTRAITIGEDERAGRWWWEDADSKECGLHAAQVETPDRKHIERTERSR